MAREFFDPSLRRVLAHEGGYVNHPNDPGGPTKYGITLATYRRHVKPDATAADVRAMPLAHARTIYRMQYADVIRFDDLPAGVDYAVFDYAVNSGVGRAGKVLRRILKMPDATSAVTEDVIRRAREVKPRDLVIAICDERLAFLKSLSTWPVFGKGWGRRVAEVRTGALDFVRQAGVAGEGTKPETDPGPAAEAETADKAGPPAPGDREAAGRGEVPEPKTTKTVIKGGAGTTAAGGGAGYWDWVCAHPVETVAIAVAGLLIVAGIIYAINRVRAIRQEAAPAGWQAPELASA